MSLFNKTNMISVVIPLYNKAHTIVNTLSTVLGQTYRDFEVIIVNDGSTDNGVEVIRSHFNDPRIRIISQKNAGVSAARNRGVDEANGEYIAFLDADDEWLPEYLETLFDAFIDYPQADMVGCASYHKNFETGEVSANALIDKFYGKAVHVNYFVNPDKMTHIGATVIRKASFLKVGGFDVKLKNNEDVLLQGSIAMNGYFVYVGQCLHVYVGNVKGQATSDASKREMFVRNKVEVLNRFYALYKSSGKANKLVPISIKYRGRHLFLTLLQGNDYRLLDAALSQLSEDLLRLFMLPKQLLDPRFRKVNILCIYLTKLIWRLHGFPIVGTPSKYNSELTKKYYSIHG